MRFLICFALLTSLAALFATAAEGAELRTWKSADGQFEVRAKLIELVENPDGKVVVVIENEAGKESRVPLQKLSSEDKGYVEGRKDRDAGIADIKLKIVRELAVEDEGPDFDEWKFESAEAKAAVKKYRTAASTRMKESEKRLNKDRRNLKRSLDKALVKATKAGKLDEAILIREAIAALGEGHVAAGKGSAGKKNRKSDAPDKKLPKRVYLDDMEELQSRVRVGFGTLGKHGLTGYPPGNVMRTIQFQGKFPTHALSTHPSPNGNAFVEYKLDKKYRKFQATVGLIENAGLDSASTLTFSVFGDGKRLWRSSGIRRRGTGQSCQVSVRNVKTLRLQVDCPGSAEYAVAIWINPQVSR